MADLRKRGIVTKVRTLKTGKTVGGIPFTRGPLAHLLRNRFYIGEVAFKGEILPGEQPAIVDRDLFDAVQAKLNEQLNNHISRTKSEALFGPHLRRPRPSDDTEPCPQARHQVSILHLVGPPAGSTGTSRNRQPDPSRSRSRPSS